LLSIIVCLSLKIFIDFMEKETKFLPWVWGFTTSAENWNGRMAMLGFLFAILIESFTGKGIIHFLGVL
jgi:hypothetical protein